MLTDILSGDFCIILDKYLFKQLSVYVLYLNI